MPQEDRHEKTATRRPGTIKHRPDTGCRTVAPDGSDAPSVAIVLTRVRQPLPCEENRPILIPRGGPG